MSNRPALSMTVTGFAAGDPELRFTPSGKPVANVSVPYTPRRLDQATQQWVDAGDTLWVRVAVWGDDAELFAEQVRKGTLVTITGRPRLDTYQGQDGQARAELAITADQWGINPRPDRPRQVQPPQQQAPTGGFATAADPWGTPTEPPF